MKKILSLIIIMSILLTLGVQAFASTNNISSENISTRYINIMTLSSSLDIDSIGIAQCGGILVQNLTDGTCKLTMKLQKLDSGDWNTIVTWTKEGTYDCSNYKERAVSKGTYRLYVVGRVYDSSGDFVESSTVYSPTKTY